MGLKPADHVWVGGTDGRFSGDSAGSGPYAWITGEPMTYTSWFSDMKTQEPDGACETKCMGNPCNCEHRIAIMADGHWLDAYEGGLMRFVCEAEM
jgi:hypothetical protein